MARLEWSRVEQSGFPLKPEGPRVQAPGINGVFPNVGGVLAELEDLLGRSYLGTPEVVRLGGVGTS